MAADYYELFQLKPEPDNDNLRLRPYRYLMEHDLKANADNYDIVLHGDIRADENAKMLRERLEKESQGSVQGSVLRSGQGSMQVNVHGNGRGGVQRSDTNSGSAGMRISISDVLAITRAGITTAYYVDPNKLILIPDFFHRPSDGSLITIDTENLPLDGRKGSWMTVDTLRLNDSNLFLMHSQDYGKEAPYVIVDEQGRELAADPKGFTEETIERVRQSLKEMESRQAAEVIISTDKSPKLEHWQQYFENGEYLRSAEISEEQNYNMIDGTANNRMQRRSVLERLQEKQTEVRQGSIPVRPQKLLQDNEIERTRK